MVETEKNRKLIEEMNISQKRIQSLQSELSEGRVSSGRPYDDINNLTRDTEKMTREIETLKRRCVNWYIKKIVKITMSNADQEDIMYNLTFYSYSRSV